MNREDFITADAELLGGIEDQIFEELQDLIDNTVERMASLPDDASDSDYEAVLTPLNDAVAGGIGAAMFMRQTDVARLALRLAPGSVPSMRSPAELMESARINGETLASHFKRRSPSKWMRNLFGQARQQVEAQVRAAIASGVWAIAGDIQQFTWEDPSRWQWITKEDEKVCSQCGPLHDVIFDAPQQKAHWSCRCECLPAPAG